MTNDMTKGSPIRLILAFSIPLFIGNVFQQFYSMADTVIVGRTIGVQALAAVGATSAISFLILGFAQGLTSGFSVVAAQCFGAGEEERLRDSVATSILLCVAATVFITILSVLTARPLLDRRHVGNRRSSSFCSSASLSSRSSLSCGARSI